MRAHARTETLQGLRDIAPVMAAAAPIGLIYGALALGKGMGAAEITGMSVLVYAGSAQFAALGLWAPMPPVLALIASTLLINLRHVLMSASLGGRIRHWRPAERWFGFFLLVDETWAFAETRALKGPLSFAYFIAMSLAYWLNWVIWSSVGAVAGARLGDPARFGADFAFCALFIALVAGFARQSRRAVVAVAASAAASALTWLSFGAPWHVMAGALAGVLAAWLAWRPGSDASADEAIAKDAGP